MFFDNFLNRSFNIADVGSLCIFKIRINLRADRIILTKDQNILNQAFILKQILQLLRSHIFSVAQNNQVLFPTGQIKESFFVQISDISGAKPAILCDCLCCLIRLLVISHHNRRALYLDLFVHNSHLTALY